MGGPSQQLKDWTLASPCHPPAVLWASFPTELEPSSVDLMLPIVTFHLRDILRPLGAKCIVLSLALDIHPLEVRYILILVASVVSLCPIDELVEVPALPGLERLVTLALAFGRQLEPRRVVCMAVEVLQKTIETVLHVFVEMFFLRLPSLGGWCEFLYLFLCARVRLRALDGEQLVEGWDIQGSAFDGMHQWHRFPLTGPKGIVENEANRSAPRIRRTERWCLHLYPVLPTARLALAEYPAPVHTRCWSKLERVRCG